MRKFLGLSLILAASLTIGLGQSQFDLLILNGRVMDGTGNPWYYADIGILDSKIVEIGNLQGTVSPPHLECLWPDRDSRLY